MEINDTLQTLRRVCQAIDAWIPRSGARPDVLIAGLNDLYVRSTKNRDLDELFEYNDVESPAVTLIVDLLPGKWSIRNEKMLVDDLLPVSGPVVMRLFRLIWPYGIPEVEA